MYSRRRAVRSRRSFLAVMSSFLLGGLTLTVLPTDPPTLKAIAQHVTGTPVAFVDVGQPAAQETLTGDWPQWGGTPSRNNTPEGENIPDQWDVGKFDRQTGQWQSAGAQNIKWVARVGSQTYGNPVVADGKIYVGTNNGAGYLERYPSKVDLGCLLCFRESDGKFLWQHSSKKLPTGRVHDWPLQGICCAPLVDGKRLWFVTSRGEVVCLDTEGFHDGQNDGPFQQEVSDARDEADVVWKYNMMKDLQVSQHNMCSCSVTAWDDVLFVHTSNGVDESHINIPSPGAPSFMAMDKHTGEVLWSDASPGLNILHGQWSSPAAGMLGGVPQVLFPGGDGWLYSFRADRGQDGRPELLWKFDCNPKDSKWILGGRGTRNNLIATPVIHDERVYIAVGQDPEHGEGIGHLWCIDPSKRGDVSPQLAVQGSDHSKPVPHRRLQAVNPEEGETAIANPNSAVIWHYNKFDQNGDGEIDFEETMHRSCGTVAIKNDLLYISDFSGLFHCLSAKGGKVHWTYDMLAAAWGSPLIVDDKVYIGDEDGDVCVFRFSAEPHEPINEINMGNSVYSTSIVANNVLYIANKTHLFAIQAAEQSAEQEAEQQKDMPKRVLNVGNCWTDHASISDLIESNFQAEVQQSHVWEDTMIALRHGQFDLVLVNRKLDQDYSDGLEVVRQIKADPDIAEVPVMMITDYAEYQQMAVQAGAEPGFGKLQLHDQETRDKLQRFLA